MAQKVRFSHRLQIVSGSGAEKFTRHSSLVPNGIDWFVQAVQGHTPMRLFSSAAASAASAGDAVVSGSRLDTVALPCAADVSSCGMTMSVEGHW